MLMRCANNVDDFSNLNQQSANEQQKSQLSNQEQNLHQMANVNYELLGNNHGISSSNSSSCSSSSSSAIANVLMPLIHETSDILNCADLNITQLTTQQIDDDDFVEHDLDSDNSDSDTNSDSEIDSDSENQHHENFNNDKVKILFFLIKINSSLISYTKKKKEKSSSLKFKKMQMKRKPNNDDFERADFHSNQKCLITSTDQTKLNLYDNNDSHINENNFITISQKDEHTLQNINSKKLIN